MEWAITRKGMLLHRDLVRGGTLKLVMGAEPNKEWAAAPGAEPPSMSGTESRNNP